MSAADRPRTAEEQSALCLACGLCCEGALHDLVPLDEDEAERAERLHLPLFESPVLFGFRLPCPHIEARRCTVYEERPRACASYRCATLTAFADRAIDESAALDRVAKLRATSAALAVRPDAETRRELGRIRKSWFDP